MGRTSTVLFSFFCLSVFTASGEVVVNPKLKGTATQLTFGGGQPRLHVVVNPKLKGTAIRSILLVPPQEDVARRPPKLRTMSQRKLQIAETAAAVCFRDLGYALPENPSLAGSNPAPSSFTLADLQKRYDSLAEEILKSTKGVARGKFTLGIPAGWGTPTDAALFLRGRSFYPQIRILGAPTGMVGGPEQFEFYLSLIYSQSGEVLFFASGTAGAEHAVDPDDSTLLSDIREKLSKCLRKFPPASALSPR